MSEVVLNKLKISKFHPMPFLKDGKSQTMAAFVYPYNPIISNHLQHIVPLNDGDKIVIVENRPPLWTTYSRTILLIHGLCGSHQSSYMVRLTQLFLRQGYRVIRMNLRGCGTGSKFAQRPYHSGLSDDARTVLHWLYRQYPESIVTQIGFSLGANITLKMLGEDHSLFPPNLGSAIAISPPLDLKASVETLLKKENQTFHHFFMRCLLQDVKKRHAIFPHIPCPKLPSDISIYEFDNLYTAPQCGFKSADDYYQQSSSLQFVHKIEVPTLILHAKDDPVVNHEAFLLLPKRDNLDIVLTEHGGHVGWIGNSGNFYRYGYHWMDRLLVEWLKQRKI